MVSYGDLRDIFRALINGLGGPPRYAGRLTELLTGFSFFRYASYSVVLHLKDIATPAQQEFHWRLVRREMHAPQTQPAPQVSGAMRHIGMEDTWAGLGSWDG